MATYAEEARAWLFRSCSWLPILGLSVGSVCGWWRLDIGKDSGTKLFLSQSFYLSRFKCSNTKWNLVCTNNFTCFGRLVNQTGIYHYIILLSFKNETDMRIILIPGSLHHSISISRRPGSYVLPNLFSETLVSLKLLFLPPPAGHSKTRYEEDLFSFVILSSEEKGTGRPHPDLTVVCASLTTSWEWHAWQMPPSCQCDMNVSVRLHMTSSHRLSWRTGSFNYEYWIYTYILSRTDTHTWKTNFVADTLLININTLKVGIQ